MFVLMLRRRLHPSNAGNQYNLEMPGVLGLKTCFRTISLAAHPGLS
jgi:hypothetical protein